MSLPLLVVLALQGVVLVASSAQQAIGFGATVLVVALSALMVPLQVVLPAFVPVNTLLSAFTAQRRWQEVRARVLFFELLPAMAPGLALGLLTFRYSADERIKLAFALLVVVLASVELWRLRTPDDPPKAPLRPLLKTVLLAFGGYIHGVFGAGGPMIVYVLRRRLPDKGELRATLALVWLVLNAPILVNYATLGLIDRSSTTLSLLLALPFWPAILLGDWLHKRLAPRRFQLAVCVLLLIAGLTLSIRTALPLWRAGGPDSL